jgi:pimeloyl-ACP methyl ester carboxylesterase
VNPEPLLVEVDGIPMSGLIAENPEPRAVIVAVHGGGTTSAYWDCPGEPELSLLRIGAALGYTVVALDRPGYGKSAGHGDRLTEPRSRVDLAYAALDTALAGRKEGAGRFLVAHSMGCELAMRMAADPRGSRLLGIELSGIGLRHGEVARRVIEARQGAARAPGRPQQVAELSALLWQPVRIYPPGIVGGAAIVSGSPAYEGQAVRTWATQDFPALAARIPAPVRFTLAEYEMVWENGPCALAEIGALFTAALRVETGEQLDGGHNLSLGLTAAAYHLKVLAFAEECLVDRHLDGTEV